MKLFVYGTLCAGQRAHHLLRGAPLLAEARTEPRFRLVEMDGYPALVAGGATAVRGEIYEVDDRLIPELDEYEDVPELYQLFFEHVRQGLFDRMTRYVATRMQTGDFAGADPSVTARFIIETVTFFARHRHLDPAPTTFDDDTVRHSIVALITRALIAPSEGERSGRRGRRAPRTIAKARS